MCQTPDNQNEFPTTAITTAGPDPADIQATRAAIQDVIRRHYAAVADGTADEAQIESCFALKAMLEESLSIIRKEHSSAMVSWLNRNGDLTIGDNRYYVGTERRTRLTRKDAAVRAILEVGGDVDALADCIASDGIKPGAFKTLCGQEKFDECFTVETVNDVKTGNPVRGLRVANARFARKAEGGDDAVDCE